MELDNKRIRVSPWLGKGQRDTLLGGWGGLKLSARQERKRESEILFDGFAYRKEKYFRKNIYKNQNSMDNGGTKRHPPPRCFCQLTTLTSALVILRLIIHFKDYINLLPHWNFWGRLIFLTVYFVLSFVHNQPFLSFAQQDLSRLVP